MAEVRQLREINCIVQVSWSDLPLLILENIYTFLNHNDQTNMSLVCRRWSEAFNAPAVWKTFRFALTGEMLNKDNCSVIKFAKRYSNLFRHVQIEYCVTNQKHLTALWVKLLETFLDILTKKSKLSSVSFRNLEYFFRSSEYRKHQNVCRMIAKFLGSQRQLKRMEFYQCSFQYKDGVEILKQLIENSRDNLISLKLRAFVRGEEQSNDVQDSIFKKILFGLPSLTDLEIDYSLIFSGSKNASEVLKLLINCRKRMILRLFLEVLTNSLKILTSNDWMKLKAANQFLEVEIYLFTSSAFHQQNEIFAVPNVPIRHMTYRFFNHSSCAVVDSFLLHLLSCNINDHLVHLSFNMARIIPSLPKTLFRFLNACKNLKILVLSIFNPMLDWDTLLKSLLERRPQSLQEFHLEALEILNENSKTMLRNLAANFIPLFMSENIHFSLNFK